MLILQNVPLAPLTTLYVGGPARYFIEAKTATEVRDAVDFAFELRILRHDFGFSIVE